MLLSDSVVVVHWGFAVVVAAVIVQPGTELVVTVAGFAEAVNVHIQ